VFHTSFLTAFVTHFHLREEESASEYGTMSSNSSASPPLPNKIPLLVGYGVLFVAVLSWISTTLYQYPLFPIQYDDLEWNKIWLLTTTVDFYGVCLCFVGVVLSSEASWVRGLAWSVGFLLLGSPVCCLWVILWIYKGRSLRLIHTAGNPQSQHQFV